MKEKLIRFMQGRYGVDKLNTHLLFLVIGLFILNMFFPSIPLTFIAYALWALVIYRMFSKQIQKRYNENMKYLAKIRPIRQFFSMNSKRLSDRQNKYFRCPQCHQMVRVPKGKGQVVITCPKCHNKFEKRT